MNSPERKITLKQIHGDHNRFYTISIIKDDATWYTHATWGPTGSTGSVSTLYKGTVLANAIMTGERFCKKRITDGYVIASGSLKRR